MPSGPHGGDAGAVAAAIGIERSQLIDLSMSMNPMAPDVAAVVAANLDRLVDYPDSARAEACLAGTIGVDRNRLVLTNGGAEAISLIAQLMPAGRVVEPEFSLYRRHLTDIDDGAPRWRSNPSNPLGRLAEIDANDPETHRGVWDEAFFPLATGAWSHPALADTAAWRVGSLTKLWACPGLRIGYAIAPDVEAAHRLRTLQPRWAVGGLSLAVVEHLAPNCDLAGWSSGTRSVRTEFARLIERLGFVVAETDANWILVTATNSAAELRSQLIMGGVVVRDCSSFGMGSVVRVAVPRVEEIDRVAAAFARVAQTVEP